MPDKMNPKAEAAHIFLKNGHWYGAAANGREKYGEGHQPTHAIWGRGRNKRMYGSKKSSRGMMESPEIDAYCALGAIAIEPEGYKPPRWVRLALKKVV